MNDILKDTERPAFNLHNDPTLDIEGWIEQTPEEEFNNSNVEVPEHAEIYIEYLLQKLKAKNLAIETLRNELQDTEQSYCRSQLRKIQYL